MGSTPCWSRSIERRRRARRLHITEAGLELLAEAVPIWRGTHDAVDAALAKQSDESRRLRADLMTIAGLD